MPMPIVYKKRVRTKFTSEQVKQNKDNLFMLKLIYEFRKIILQLDVLEATFQQHRYPSVDIVDNLVEQLDLPTQKVTVKKKYLLLNSRLKLENSVDLVSKSSSSIKKKSTKT